MNEELPQLLQNLRLPKMAQIITGELAAAGKSSPSYTDFLARLLRAEWLSQQERKMQSRIKLARIPELWSIESFPFKQQPGVSRRQLRELAELEFIPKAVNIVFIGPTGVGKTGLASGLLLKALQNGYRGLFLKAQELFDDMYASLADRSSRKLLKRLARLDVLLIDELGYLNLRPEQTNIFFKLMEERYRRKATLLTTNLEYDQWQVLLGNKELTEALLSRLRHQCQSGRRAVYCGERADHSHQRSFFARPPGLSALPVFNLALFLPSGDPAPKRLPRRTQQATAWRRNAVANSASSSRVGPACATPLPWTIHISSKSCCQPGSFQASIAGSLLASSEG
jgi:DNA replication protein DnaC